MIQANGIIKDSNGVTEYANPLINVYMNSSSKFTPTLAVAQVGKLTEATETQPASFSPVAAVGTYEYTEPNPNFEAVQLVVLAGLKADYPTVTFTIV